MIPEAMRRLDPPDVHYLNAASGWLDLGNLAEAWAELDRIATGCQDDPEVLEMRWRLEAESGFWEESLHTASRLLEVAPSSPAGWIHRSYSLHELKRTEEARQHLLQAVQSFEDLPVIPYNLACYACQLGHLDEARRWIGRVVELQGKDATKRMGLADPDLTPLHAEIARL